MTMGLNRVVLYLHFTSLIRKNCLVLRNFIPTCYSISIEVEPSPPSKHKFESTPISNCVCLRCDSFQILQVAYVLMIVMTLQIKLFCNFLIESALKHPRLEFRNISIYISSAIHHHDFIHFGNTIKKNFFFNYCKNTALQIIRNSIF